MTGSSRRRSIAVVTTLGVCLVAVAVTLNVGWIVLNWRTWVLATLGALFFALLIGGVVVNTAFLVREIRRNEQQDSFLNAVTHELKTPVASIRLYLQTLQSRNLDDTRRREFYRIMLEDSDRLNNTIEQVLRAGRAGSTSRGDFAPADLAAIVQECLALALTRHHLPPEAIAYRESLPAQVKATVLGDHAELKAAILNLLDNAVQYSGEQVRVVVELLCPDERTVAVRVQDHGVGIPRPELKRIFRRFYRIPQSSGAPRVKGTGLGLFIVQSVARKHGGRILAASDGPQRGSTFTLVLPVSEAGA
jgi:signal transduction histidine kinase